MADTEIMSWVDRRGKQQAREVNLTVDIRQFEGRAGYPHLFMAANPRLSYEDLLRYLDTKKHAARTRSWLQRHRWMYHPSANGGARPNRDGRDARAIAIMRVNPALSLRDLVLTLKDNGIRRSKDWVRQHRCE